MNDILVMIKHLTAMYSSQLETYNAIFQMGDQEKTLILKGKIPQLVELLEEKQQQIAVIAGSEDDILQGQKSIADYFSLSEFSLPKIKKIAKPIHQSALNELEHILGQLVEVLEKLEVQEQAHESLLGDYGQKLQAQMVKVKPGGGAVKTAYKKFTNREKCGNKS